MELFLTTSNTKDVTMGEEGAREYDSALIFRHLCANIYLTLAVIDSMISCFYLDTPQSAGENGMTANTKYEKEITEKYDSFLRKSGQVLITHDSFNKVFREIEANGGRIVGLDDPKLTHIVLDKRDTSRRLSLMQRTAK